MSGTYNEVQVKELGHKSGQQKSLPNNKVGKSLKKRTPFLTSSTQSEYNSNMERTQNGQPNTQNSQSSQGSQTSQDSNQHSASWPPSLVSFVSSSFKRAEMLSPAQKATFNDQIQNIIYAAASANKIWTNKWELQKLPIFDGTSHLILYQDTVEGRNEGRNEGRKEVKKVGKTVPQIETTKRPTEFNSADRKRQRAERFQDCLEERSATPPAPPPLVSPTGNTPHIVGTSTALEKRYLRLTSEPDPSKVRPQEMIRKCLKFVIDKYRTNKLQYSYINDQLKAIRQDLTVQHIKGKLAIIVYEAHGRIAIENNDLGEFNQCQAQLKTLYEWNEHPNYFKKTYEFTCYRILYFLITHNYADINLMRLELLDADQDTIESNLPQSYVGQRHCVYKSLELVDMVILGDYYGFFECLKWFKALNYMEGAYHMLNQFVANKQRIIALHTMCKAFKKLPLDYLEDLLALDKDSSFFSDFRLHGFISGADFDCSAARLTLQAVVDQGQFKKVDIKGQV